MQVLIREAQLDDAEGIVRVMNPIIEAGAYTVLSAPLTTEAEREYLSTFPQRGIFHVAGCTWTHEIVALQSVEPFGEYTQAYDHVGVVGTFVDLSRRRRGIGKQLSHTTFEAARRKGYRKLFTFVRADNRGALAFYLKLAFRIVGEAYDHARLDGRYVNEIIIEKLL